MMKVLKEKQNSNKGEFRLRVEDAYRGSKALKTFDSIVPQTKTTSACMYKGSINSGSSVAEPED